MKLSSLALAIKTLSNSPFKAKAILFDSCPGRISLQVSLKSPEQRICETYPTQAGMNAAKPVMPKNWYTYYPLYFTMLGMAIATGIVYDVTGIEDSMKRSRRLLNDKETFSLETKRGYVFSDADDIVVAKDVLDHAVEARERGWDVGIERFVGTGHCGHLRGDEKRYWGIVEGLVGKEFMRSKL